MRKTKLRGALSVVKVMKAKTTANAIWSVHPVYCLNWASKWCCMKYRNITLLIQWVVRHKCADNVKVTRWRNGHTQAAQLMMMMMWSVTRNKFRADYIVGIPASILSTISRVPICCLQNIKINTIRTACGRYRIFSNLIRKLFTVSEG